MKQRGSKMTNRIIAVLVGMAIIFALDRWGSAPWYVYLPLAVFGYGCVRYIGYFVREHGSATTSTERWLRIMKL
jgi:hypothetical protein